MTTISNQSQVCLDAVVNCENVLVGLDDKKPLSSQILKLLNFNRLFNFNSPL